ncbi:MAG: putative porin [Candidatus Omnitrophota bacterium]
MKRILSLLLAVMMLSGVSALTARAAEIDVLLNKLVEKGVLTPLEAQIIQDETKQDVAEQIAKGTHNTLPSWLQTIKLKGDLRLRYQADEKESDTSVRNRGRYRLRLGAYAQPHPDLAVGMRIATGSSNDSRSTNETMGDNFSKDDLWIDLAYAEYTPTTNFSLIGGKFKRKSYLWAATDLLWDGDINPEGVSAHVSYPLMGDTTLFGNAGAWLIDEKDGQSTSDTDPFLHYYQGGMKMKSGNLDGKLAAIYYGFDGVQGEPLDNSAESNTVIDTVINEKDVGLLVYDYDAVGASAEFGIKKLFGGLPMGIDNRIAVFGDYIQNISDNVEKDSGFAVGAKFGHKSVKKPGTWQMKYIYAELEKDAFIDAYPDSDRYGGQTDIQAHELSWKYAWKKNVTFGLDYYHSDKLDADSDAEDLLQADLLIKF